MACVPITEGIRKIFTLTLYLLVSKQWKWLWINQKMVYNIEPKKILGCCKVSDDFYDVIKTSTCGLYAWTLTNDNYIIAANRSTGSILNITDGEQFCFICY